MKIGQAAHGAASMMKTAVGVGRVTKAVQAERMATCGVCPQKTVRRFCKVCECYIPRKSLDASERCPMGYWKR